MKFQLSVAFQQLLVHDLQAAAIILIHAAGLLHLLHNHRIFDRDRNDAGEHAQQIQIATCELTVIDLIDRRNTTQKMALALKRHQYQRPRFFFPTIALLFIQIIKHTAPPGFPVPPHPAANTEIEWQRLTYDFIAVHSCTCTINVGFAIHIDYRNQQSFRLDQLTGAFGNELKQIVQVQFTTDFSKGTLQQIDL